MKRRKKILHPWLKSGDMFHHPNDLILNDPKQGLKTRSSLNLFNNLVFISQIELKNFRNVEYEECFRP